MNTCRNVTAIARTSVLRIQTSMFDSRPDVDVVVPVNVSGSHFTGTEKTSLAGLSELSTIQRTDEQARWRR